MPRITTPFYYLDKSVNVLLVDDNAPVLALLRGILNPVRVYAVSCASTAQQAEKILSSPDRTHLCVMDLGIADRHNDEFYLLRRFGGRVSFVIVTGRSSPSKGFAAHRLGAKALIEKTGAFNHALFLETVNRLSLRNIINPAYHAAAGDSLSRSTDLLFEKSPAFVSQWATYMGMTDRTLRHIWTQHLGANAKIILSIHQMFTMAFDYYKNNASACDDTAQKKITDSGAYQRLEDFFHLHKSIITDFITFGNVAAFI